MCIANMCEMRRFTLPPEIFDGPLVSVLIPARNEEFNIEHCLTSLSNQDYGNYEILVLNDNSTDKTLEICNSIAAKDNRIRVINGEPLHDDWYGKSFALHQLTAQAKGEILVYTDADTIHAPTSISWAVTNIQKLKADMISGYVGQVFRSFGELITVSLMFILTGFAIPIFLNRLFVKVSLFSVAVGQFIVIRKNVIDAIGGWEFFKKEIPEDMYMSKYLKRKGYKTRFLNITKHISCRMYDGYHPAIEGIGKNIFGFFGKNAILLFLLILGVILFFLSFPLLLYNIITSNPWTLHNAIFVSLFTLTWILTFIGQRLKWWYGFLWPILMLNLVYMAAWSLFRNVSGRGFLWKSRIVGKKI